MHIGLYSILPFFGVMAVAALTGMLLTWRWDFYRQLTDPRTSRMGALDGFRGLLALGVFLHHATVNYTYRKTGVWGFPDSTFYRFLGPGCLAYFFMISGFLFWGKVLDGKLSAKPLLVSRFWRVMPMYWATALVVVVTAVAVTRFHLQEGVGALILESLGWASGGLLGVWPFNGVPTHPLNAGVTWSLQYEWFFYLLLPVLAVTIVKPRRFIALLLGYTLLFGASKHFKLMLAATVMINSFPFFGGMSAAYLVRIPAVHKFLRSHQYALLMIAFQVGGLWLFDYLHFEAKGIFFVPIFLGVAAGNTVFGFLTQRWAIFLGHISYSVYLMHGIILFYALALISRIVSFGELSPGMYWAYILAAAFFVVSLSAITFRFIESPFLVSSNRRGKQDGSQRKSTVELPGTQDSLTGLSEHAAP